MAFLDDAGLVQLWQNIMARLSNKMDVTPGKVLSSNDFTDEYKEKLASLAQSNWEASEEEDGYIKNRTHWLETEIGEIVPEINLTFTSYNGFPACFSPEPYMAYPSVNTTYKVIWRGQEYECVSHEGTVNGITVVALGNSAPVFAAFGSNDGMNTDDPFAICFMPESAVSAFNAYTIWLSFDGYEHTVAHVFGEKLNYHKLDKNYLPIMNDFLVNGNNYSAVHSVASPDDEYKMGEGSVAFGERNKACGWCSAAFGYGTIAAGSYSSSMGQETLANGSYSVAEGLNTTAINSGSHAEGSGEKYLIQVTPTSDAREYIIKSESDDLSFPSILKNRKVDPLLAIFYKWDGGYNYTWAHCKEIIEEYSNNNVKIKVDYPFSFQPNAEKQEEYSGWIIFSGYAEGNYAHAEGGYTIVKGHHSHTEGYRTYSESNCQHVQGKYNATSTLTIEGEKINCAHIVGNGTSDDNRSNAHALDWNGNAYFAGDVYTNGDGKNDFAGMKKLATTEYVDNIKKQFTAIFSKDNWGETSPYLQTIDLEGIYETDNPIVDIDVSALNDYGNNLILGLESWGFIDVITTHNGQLEAICSSEKPQVDLPIQLMVIR